jgi:type I restriction enzyme R subunit
LSRLNRCYQKDGVKKDTTYVLDFVNESAEVLAAFKTFYTTAALEDVTDPNIVLNLRTKLDATGYYDEPEIDRVVTIELDPTSKQKQLDAAIAPVADRLLKQFAAARVDLKEAEEKKDESAASAARDKMGALIMFRSDVGTYQRVYTFLSQIFDYGNTDFEKRSIFFKYLLCLLKFGREREGVDLSEVVLTHHTLRNKGKQTMQLADTEYPELQPLTEAGSGQVREDKKAYLNEIIEKLNEVFGKDTTDGDQLSFARTLAAKALESETLAKQAAANTKEQFANSPDLTSEIMDAIIDSMDVQSELSTRALESEVIREALKQVLINRLGLYEALRKRSQGSI